MAALTSMGLQNGGTANEVTGNLTLAMNALAGMNSYVLFHPVAVVSKY